MSIRPLPEHPNLDQLRRQAKELRDAVRAADAAAEDRVQAHLGGLPPTSISLSAAQLVIAREHGFASWPALKAEVEARTMSPEQLVDAFLAASIDREPGRAVRLLERDAQVASRDLNAAAVLGEVAEVRAALARHSSLAVSPDRRRGWPPLLYVCHSRWHRIDPARAAGMLDVARLLLDAGASPDTSNGRLSRRGYQSALYGAAGVANNPAITQLLLERGASPDDEESVYHSVYHGDHACLRLLLAHGARVQGTNALGAILGSGDVEGVRMLVEAGGDPGRPQPVGMAPDGHLNDMSINPLPAAVASDTAEVVEVLLEAGADPNARCEDGSSPLRKAVRRGALDVAATLRRHGAHDDATEVDEFLGACARADRARADELLAASPALRDQLTDDDRSTLVEAAGRVGVPAVELMLDLGFTVDSRNQRGETALHEASYAGRADVVQLLLERGAEKDALDTAFDSTPLTFATVGSGERPRYSPAADWVATVRALLEAGASGVWITGKPPSDEVAAILHAQGITSDEEADPSRPEPAHRPPADPAEVRRIGEGLRIAFDSEDLGLIGSLFDPNVRWVGVEGCNNRAQVLDWYRDRSRYFKTAVTEVVEAGDGVVVGLAVTWPDGRQETVYHAFRMAGSVVAEIHGGYVDREEALAEVS